MNLSEQEVVRRENLEKIRELGIDPYPSDLFSTNAFTSEIRAGFDEKKKNYQDVCLGGRLMMKRIMGKASFAELQDSEGRIQIS